MNLETRCQNIGCDRHLGYNLEKSDTVVYCKGCRHYTHFRADGAKKVYMREFLPRNLKQSFQDKLQNQLIKK